MLFKDRHDAGEKLAIALNQYANRDDVLILALPRGGVVLGYELAVLLHAPLDLILVRKLGVPGQEELALGAIAANQVRILNQSIIATLKIPPETIEKIVLKEQQELDRRNRVYRQNKPFPVVKDKVVILVDDGIATGASIRAAIKILIAMEPKKIIVAVPVASGSIFEEIKDQKVDLMVLATPEPFYGIGMWYGSFPQLADQEVIDLLAKANKQEE